MHCKRRQSIHFVCPKNLERFLMDKPKEKENPDVDLPLTYIEMQDMLSGKKFTWELPNRNNGKKTIIHAYLDNRGIFIEKEEE